MKVTRQEASFKEMVEVRKQEMEGILPGFMSTVTDGVHTAVVYSPDVEQRSTFSIKEEE